jgi:uncharacterized protein YbcI
LAPDSSDPSASQLMQVSRALMRVYKEYLGRGPDRAHTHHAGNDGIVCFLEGTLTPVERTLTTIAAHQRLRETRTLIQDAAEAEMCRLVESITGRAVTASTSGFDVRADVATEAFKLGPAVSGERLVPLCSGQ